MVVALVISLLTGPMKGSQIDAKLMYPIIDYILPCLPNRMRQKLWCGVKYDEGNGKGDAEGGHHGYGEAVAKGQANGEIETSKL